MRTFFRCRVRCIAALLLFGLWESPIFGGGSRRELHSLRLGDTFDGRCSVEGQTPVVEVSAGEYFRAWLEPSRPLYARILGPTGQMVLAAELGPDAAAPLSFLASQTGKYQVDVRCERGGRASSGYRLHFEVRRLASEGDVQRLSMDRAFLAAEELARGWREQPRRSAVEALERVLASSKEIGGPFLEARVFTRLGDLYWSLGETRAALKHYQQALSLEQGPTVEVDALLGAAVAHLRLDERDKALALTRKALALSTRSGDQREQARALTTLGVAHYELEQFPEAIDSLQQALAYWRRLGDARGESEALMHAGFAYSDLSEERKAMETHRQALGLARRVQDRRLEALILTAVGNIYSKMGQKQQALNFYYQANPLLEAIGDPFWTVSVYSGMGYVYAQLGDGERAIGYYTRALENNRRISSDHGEAETLIHLGRVHLSLGEIEKGLACFRTALHLFETLGRVRMQSVALSDIGETFGLLGRDVEALEYYARALALYEASGFKREEANALNDVGRIEERGGRVETAVRHYRRALALSRETQDRFAESQSLLNLARVARASGDLDQARRDAEQALGLAEELRSNVASYSLRASYFASIHELHEFYVDLLMELHGKRPSEGFDRLAFQASEKARARSLLETLSEEQPDGRDLDPKLLERRAQLERKIRASAGAWEKRTGRAAVGEAGAGSSSELDELLAELDRVRAVIRSQAPGYDLLEFDLASAEEIQNELLDSSTLMLSYFLGADRSFLWALTRTTLAVHVLPPREEIEARVQTLYRLLAARERIQDETAKEYYQRVSDSDREFWESASLLSTELLGPVVGELGTKRLVIIGDGALHHFPFSALPIPAPAGDSDALPLIAEHEIVRLPSASTLMALRTRDLARPKPPKTVAILADPVFDRYDPRVESPPVEDEDPGAPVAKALPVSSSAWALTRALEDVGLGEGESVPRLLASQQEAKGILSMVPPEESLAALGFDASRALATSGELTQYQVIHFATHGILNTKHPELSGIILSMVDEQGNPQDGFLRLHDIETLHLPANLVVLSACSSGLGKEVKGEGMIGLVRGFMSAGADRVLASYWNVDDEATAELMKRFYGNLFTRSLAPAAALREAQRSMWQEKRWRSPFYWAAFELQGQWQ